MTKKQLQVLDFIKSYYAANGFYPSMREVADHLGVTISTIQGYYSALQASGDIVRDKYKSRVFFIKDMELPDRLKHNILTQIRERITRSRDESIDIAITKDHPKAYIAGVTDTIIELYRILDNL